ncbi:MAG: peptidylprolyl isomerase [bacterium]|nr:peptidylprolyl isomerase [bacterium]
MLLLVAGGAGAQQWEQWKARSVPEDLAAPPADAERSASGLAWKVLTPGTGDKPADANDRVAVHFTGWTAAGVEFQTTVGQEKPAVFKLQEVFPGWREAMQLMVIGEERRLWIPERLGPPNPKSGRRGDAVFDVRMVAIQRIPNPPTELGKPPEDAERTLSGAFTRRIETGWGDEYPADDAAVLVHYTGWTTDGKTFDSSIRRNRPTAFPLGKVMPPFAEALRMMVIGETRQVWIPGNLAAGNWPGSPQGMLIFELKLMDILPEGSLGKALPPEAQKIKPGSASEG